MTGRYVDRKVLAEFVRSLGFNPDDVASLDSPLRIIAVEYERTEAGDMILGATGLDVLKRSTLIEVRG